MPDIALNSSYDRLTRSVVGTLLLDSVPEVTSAEILLFNETTQFENNRTPNAQVTLEPTEDTVDFTFTNMPNGSYVVRAFVTTAYTTYQVEETAIEGEIVEGFAVDKDLIEYTPEDIETDISVIDPFLNPFNVQLHSSHPLEEQVSSGATDISLFQPLLYLDFGIDSIMLGGTGYLTYIGGGQRVLETLEGEQVLQVQNETTSNTKKLVEGSARNLIHELELDSSGNPEAWSVEQGNATYIYSVLNYPLEFTNTIKVEAFNFRDSDGEAVILKSNRVNFSNVQPLALKAHVMVRTQVESGEQLYPAETLFPDGILYPQDEIALLKIVLRYYTSFGEYVDERRYVINAVQGEFYDFDALIETAEHPPTATKIELWFDYGLMYPGYQSEMLVYLPNVNQLGVISSDIMGFGDNYREGKGIREGDVYRVQWQENVKFDIGAFLMSFIPNSNLSCTLFDTGNVKCTYDGQFNFETDCDTLQTSAMSLKWLDSCIDILNDPPTTPITEDRYLIGDFPTGDWIHNRNEVAEFDGTIWQFTAPVLGESLKAGEKQLVWSGTNWLGNNQWEEGTVTVACCYGGGTNSDERRIFVNGFEITSDANFTALTTVNDFMHVGCDTERENQINAEMKTFSIIPIYDPHRHRKMETTDYILSQVGHQN